MKNYDEFLRSKIALARDAGVPISATDLHENLKPHQRDIVAWAVRGGRRAIFAAFGLGKTLIQLAAVRATLRQAGGNGLIVCPLGVRQEFKRDASKIDTTVEFVRSNDEVSGAGKIYLTNYESIREGKLDPTGFSVVSLDEAAILRGTGGTKTFRELMRHFEGTSTYRFVATATPSPNDYIELLAYAAYLGIMEIGEAKTRFFKRNAEKADQLTIHPHKEKEFWTWVASWAVFIDKPSDLGYDDTGYDLPELVINWHELPSDHSQAGSDRDGQHRLIQNSAIGVQNAAREKRHSLDSRVEKLLQLRAEDPEAHRLIWHDLESERHAIESAIPTAATIYGAMDLDAREQTVIDFSDGKIAELAAKPVLAGSGCNFQYHCSWAIFLGIGFKFNDFIQAIHRIHRFLQPRQVRIDLIYTEAEREVRRTLERKWTQHNALVKQMTDLIKAHGLANAAKLHAMQRTMGVKRQELSGERWTMVNADCVEETRALGENSVDLILTSIPFSTQYEYTSVYNDFGNNESNGAFFEQMDFLTPELLRVLKPGRVAVIHVKDRIVPGGITGLGFQTVYPFHAECIRHYQEQGFAYMGMKTIVTDVVRENNQTYRLGWSEQCKDGTKMGWGMPEYLLLFRKPPTDRTNSYADNPVRKKKSEYSLARWQVDAHGFQRSSGNRPLTPDDLQGVPHHVIYKLFREHSLSTVYDYDLHVALGDELKRQQILPVTFMLLPPHSNHPDVWTDVARMRTLNGAQYAKGKQMHLCPMQFDIADRVITQFSMKGETVYDPFAGLGTVPYCAVKLERHGLGVELNAGYFIDAVHYLRAAEREVQMPDLFSLNGFSESECEEDDGKRTPLSGTL